MSRFDTVAIARLLLALAAEAGGDEGTDRARSGIDAEPTLRMLEKAGLVNPCFAKPALGRARGETPLCWRLTDEGYELEVVLAALFAPGMRVSRGITRITAALQLASDPHCNGWVAENALATACGMRIGRLHRHAVQLFTAGLLEQRTVDAFESRRGESPWAFRLRLRWARTRSRPEVEAAKAMLEECLRYETRRLFSPSVDPSVLVELKWVRRRWPRRPTLVRGPVDGVEVIWRSFGRVLATGAFGAASAVVRITRADGIDKELFGSDALALRECGTPAGPMPRRDRRFQDGD